ncbi:hypothetical protein Tco_1176035 [Tanacetum coccineum]
MTSFNNSFYTLTTIKKGDELGSNGGSSNSGKKVIQDVYSLASDSQNNTHLVARINEQESKMFEEKLVLLDDDDDDGKPLEPSTSTFPSSKKFDDMVNEDNGSEVEEVYDETATYMASTSFNVNDASKSGSGGGNKILPKLWKEIHGEDSYDDDNFDDPSLTDTQMKFANSFDINLYGQLRWHL